MMIYPPIAKLVEKTGSRYTLVIEAAKRARQLSAGSEALFYSSQELDRLTEKDLKNPEVFRKALASLSKL